MSLILQMKNIDKSFPGVKALDDVHLNIYTGEAMALIGENGAGKSTLMKILSGVYSRDGGTIIYDGEEIHPTNPKEATDLGISIIHQELNIIKNLTIYENVFLGREPTKGLGFTNKKEMIEKTREILHSLGIDIDPRTKAGRLSIAQQQMVEIAKAISTNAKVLILDEPTDTLTDRETRVLFDLIERLKSQGKALVYISHRLEEIFEVCERVTVLRDGQFIGEEETKDITEPEIVEMMVGRTLDEQYPYMPPMEEGKKVLEVKNLSNEHLKNVSLDLYEGEVLGVSGLVGAGRTELAKTIYGLYPKESGEILLKGESIDLKSASDALDHGIVYVSEDRKNESLILGMNITENITLPSIQEFLQSIRINKSKEKKVAGEYVEAMNIRTPSVTQRVKNLSGGNQQKVAIAKSLLTHPEVLILDEPTRGVDVGAKREIYELLNEIKKEGRSIIMISSDMPEILGLSDRVLVMRDGESLVVLDREEATGEKIMGHIMKEREEND